MPKCNNLWRSLVGYSPWGRKESDTTERLHFTPFTHFILYRWRREWQPTPVFLPGESHGQRSLAGHRTWGHERSDTTDWAHLHACWKLNLLSFCFLKGMSHWLLHKFNCMQLQIFSDWTFNRYISRRRIF